MWPAPAAKERPDESYKPHFVEGSDPQAMHRLMAATLDTVTAEIRAIQTAARSGVGVAASERPRWPMIVL